MEYLFSAGIICGHGSTVGKDLASSRWVMLNLFIMGTNKLFIYVLAREYSSNGQWIQTLSWRAD